MYPATSSTSRRRRQRYHSSGRGIICPSRSAAVTHQRLQASSGPTYGSFRTEFDDEHPEGKGDHDDNDRRGGTKMDDEELGRGGGLTAPVAAAASSSSSGGEEGYETEDEFGQDEEEDESCLELDEAEAKAQADHAVALAAPRWMWSSLSLPTTSTTSDHHQHHRTAPAATSTSSSPSLLSSSHPHLPFLPPIPPPPFFATPDDVLLTLDDVAAYTTVTATGGGEGAAGGLTALEGGLDQGLSNRGAAPSQPTPTTTDLHHHAVSHPHHHHHHHPAKRRLLSTIDVFLASCETMWGVLIFLKFGWCVGQVGLVATLGAVFISALCQSLSASSLSAVATNGIVTRSGGAYYMLVRSIGSAGAAIGTLYFLGMSSLVAVEVYGAAEGAELLIRGNDSNDGDAYWIRVLLCFSFLVLLLFTRLWTQRRVRLILSSCVLFLFFFSLAACCGGILTSLSGRWFPPQLHNSDNSSINYPRPSLRILAANLLLPRPVTFEEFRLVLSIVYPSFLGIFQGANLCSELKRPFQAIPRGTFSSVLASVVLYSFVFITAALAAPASILREDEQLLLKYAWPSPLVGYAGTMSVGLISALSCYEIAPRICQCIAEDRAIPILNRLDLSQVYTFNHEPGRAVLLTFVLVSPFMFVKNIDFIARAASVCFLTMYASMNFACFLQSSLQLHSWRPHFSFYSWYTALFGTLACIFTTFYLDGFISLAILGFAACLFMYIELKGDVKIFGHGIRGLRYHIALTSLLGMDDLMKARVWDVKREQVTGVRAISPSKRQRVQEASAAVTRVGGLTDVEERQVVASMAPTARVVTGTESAGTGGYWRPQILVYLSASNEARAQSRKHQLLAFVSMLKASRGLTIAASVLVEEAFMEDLGKLGKEEASIASLMGAKREEARDLKRRIMVEMAREGVLGFAEVVTAPDLRSGLSMLLQLCGLGGLRPNTCVLAWPDLNTLTRARALTFLEFIARAAVHEKAVVSLKIAGSRFAAFPSSTTIMRGPMDVWWLLHDGGILILVAYLLQRHVVWRRCPLRLFTVVQGTNVVKVQKDLSEYLHSLRIRAEVHVVSLALQDMGAYGTDWTVRRKRTETFTDARGGEGAGGDGGVRRRRSSLHTMFEPQSAADEDTKPPSADTHHREPSLSVSFNIPSHHPPPATQAKHPAGVASVTAPSHLTRGPTSSIESIINQSPGEAGTPSSTRSRGGVEEGPSAAAVAAAAATEKLNRERRHEKIRRAILEHSINSSLVLINLPPPPKGAWKDPESYFHLVEELTGELSRVVLVYGSGAEVLTQYI